VRPRTGGAAPALWPWLFADRGLLIVTGALIGLAAAALLVTWGVAADAGTAVEKAKLQVEAIKYGLGSVAAAGAAAALLLAVRRQRHAEQIHEHTVDDAAERRVTDLYTKAAEQLGHDDAAVRLAGLYALERVAQNNPDQRQTIVNVLCAYLRMPYTPPEVRRSEASDSPGPLTALPLHTDTRPAAEGRDPRQELQVRLTAQRILTAHLRLPDGMESEDADNLVPASDQPFWPEINLDLTGAALTAWDLRRGHVRNATYVEATFAGSAVFAGATFTGDACFSGVAFTGDALFDKVTFTGDASFAAAEFAGHAKFDGADFSAHAAFEGSTFARTADFTLVGFTRDAQFGSARFASYATFAAAEFAGDALFDKVTFAGDASFPHGTFAAMAAPLDPMLDNAAHVGRGGRRKRAARRRGTAPRAGSPSYRRSAGPRLGPVLGGLETTVAASTSAAGSFDLGSRGRRRTLASAPYLPLKLTAG
jgi:hypothetical protein